MKRLIVNADDLGRTAGINRGILEAHQGGVVTSASLMVSYEGAREAVRLAAECPRLGIGLHVALTGGLPVLPPAHVPSLVDALGRLPPKPDGLRGADPAEIAAEARAQLERFQELSGRLPTHFDSHHHSHRQPAVLDALLVLARQTGLPVRCASPEMRERLRAEGVRTTDAFVESFYDQGATLAGLLGILDALADGDTELMCHPAHADPELLANSSYAAVRERELAVLTSPELPRALETRGIQLITFADL